MVPKSADGGQAPASPRRPGKPAERKTRRQTAADPQQEDPRAGDLFDRNYEPGRWDTPGLFLPTLKKVQDNEDMVANFRQKVISGDLNGVKLMLHAGFPPMAVLSPRRRRPALYLAAEVGDETMCQLLIRFNADPEQPVKTTGTRSAFTLQGPTPLEVARRREHLPVVHMFEQLLLKNEGKNCELDRGVDPPPRFEFPLRLELKANERSPMGPREPKL